MNFLGCLNFLCFKVFFKNCKLFFFSSNLLFDSCSFLCLSLRFFLFLLVNLSSFSTRFLNLSLEFSKFSIMLSPKFLFDSSYSFVSGYFLLGLELFIFFWLFFFLLMSPYSICRIRLSSSSDGCS